MDKDIEQDSPFLSLMIQNPENETITDKKNIIKKLKLGFTETPAAKRT